MKITYSKIADVLETGIGALAFVSMFLAIVLQVFFRYILGDPLVWPFELSVFCYIYVIYIGSVMAARKGSHISFDLVYNRLPGRLSHAAGFFSNLFIGVIFLATLPSSVGYIRKFGAVQSSALSIPWGVVLAVFPLGMGSIALVLLLRAYSDAVILLSWGGKG